MVDDVKRAADCGVSGVVMEIPSSHHLIEKAYRWPVERAIEASVEATKLAHENGLKVSFFPIDATRAGIVEYLDVLETGRDRRPRRRRRARRHVRRALTPRHALFVRRTRERLGVPLETHFHMDFGMGVANTLLAVAEGVEVIQTTVTGIGERAGNTPMEETVLALLTMYGIDTGIRTERFFELSKLVMELAGVSQPSNRPVVGERLYNVESGIITTWVRNVGDDLPRASPTVPSWSVSRPRCSCSARAPASTRSPRRSSGWDVGHREQALAILDEVKARSLADEGPGRRRGVHRDRRAGHRRERIDRRKGRRHEGSVRLRQHRLEAGINWDAVRACRLERARDAMARHGLGAMLLMYDENIRYVTSTLTPGWNRLKPGLRYAVLVEGKEPILYEQGDIGIHIKAHSPWIPQENVRHSFAWIKGAAGPGRTDAGRQVHQRAGRRPRGRRREGQAARRGLHRHHMMKTFERAGITWTDGMTPMMEARAVKSPDEQNCSRIVGSICDALHYEMTQFIRPGLTENQVAAFGFEYLYSFPGVEDVEDVIVSSGPNAWPNWRNFSDRIIRPGELVIIDVAALTWNGFKSCVYRTYCVGGKPTDEMKSYYDTALTWLRDSIDAVKPGVTTRDIASKWP